MGNGINLKNQHALLTYFCIVEKFFDTFLKFRGIGFGERKGGLFYEEFCFHKEIEKKTVLEIEQAKKASEAVIFGGKLETK